MEEGYIQFDRQKLKAVVHFICDKCPSDELGNVKLHKILYFADMLHFMHTGKPLTGVDYVKQRFGPTARHLSSVLSELSRDGVIRIESRDYFGFEKKAFIVLSQPVNLRLSNSETKLLDDVISFVCGKSAKEISELSHDAAWNAAALGERIPYAAAFGLQPVEVTDEDREAGIAEAKRIRGAVERDRRASRLL